MVLNFKNIVFENIVLVWIKDLNSETPRLFRFVILLFFNHLPYFLNFLVLSVRLAFSCSSSFCFHCLSNQNWNLVIISWIMFPVSIKKLKPYRILSLHTLANFVFLIMTHYIKTKCECNKLFENFSDENIKSSFYYVLKWIINRTNRKIDKKCSLFYFHIFLRWLNVIIKIFFTLCQYSDSKALHWCSVLMLLVY